MNTDPITAVCIYHKGSYNNLRNSYNIIMKYIEENNYEVIENPRECYIDGCFNKDNENDYLTEIQVPVKRKKQINLNLLFLLNFFKLYTIFITYVIITLVITKEVVMSTSKKVQSSDIMSVSLEIVKEKGIEGVNAREIAKRLGISVQPIFYQFNNMEELKNELLKYCLNYYKKYILEIRGNGPKYKEIGINYIKFAKEESKLFKYIFMGNHHVKIEEFAHFDESYSQVEEILSRYKGFSEDETRKIHLKMWMFTHGIACLIATGTCEFSDEEISNLLTEEFQALTFNSIKSKN